MRLQGLVCFVLVTLLVCTAEGRRPHKASDRSWFGDRQAKGQREGHLSDQWWGGWSQPDDQDSDESQDRRSSGWQSWKDTSRDWLSQMRSSNWLSNPGDSSEDSDSNEQQTGNHHSGSRGMKHSHGSKDISDWSNGRWHGSSWKNWWKGSRKSEDNSDNSDERREGSSWKNWWKDSRESEDSSDNSDKRWQGSSWKNWWKDSRESSSEEDLSTDRMTSDWCEKWCQKWASCKKNFRELFSLAGFIRRIRGKERNAMIVNKCKELVSQTGLMCSYNETEEVSTTMEPISTTYQEERPCVTNTDCDSNECCALTLKGGVMGLFCTGYGGEGQACTKTEYWTEAEQQVLPSDSCPCQSGLECTSEDSPMRRIKYSKDKTYVESYSITGVCSVQRSNETSPTVTNGTTDMTANMTTEELSTPVPERNSTEPLVTCDSHLDCPFFQCCARPDDTQSGTCLPFSSLGDFCIPQDSLFETDITAACPCQAFYKCLRTNADVGGAYGVCAAA